MVEAAMLKLELMEFLGSARSPQLLHSVHCGETEYITCSIFTRSCEVLDIHGNFFIV